MNIINALWVIGSMSISTSLIMTNKYIMSHYDFRWPISLSCYHFVMTFILLEIMCRIRLIERSSSVPNYARWLNAFFNVCGIIFMNFNLKMNSIGFYQLSKLACIPVMVASNYLIFGNKTSVPILITLTVLIIGLAMFTVNDVQFNVVGSIIAVISILFTTASQTYTHQCAKNFNCNGPSLQHATALQMAVYAFFAAVVLEFFTKDSILFHYFDTKEAIYTILTGFLAVGSNICAFALIGNLSAITYQVVGHAKTILIFVFGLVFYDSSAGEPKAKTIKKIIGLIISMAGTIAYTALEMKAKSEKKAGDEQQLKEEDPLNNQSEEGFGISEDEANLKEEEEETAEKI